MSSQVRGSTEYIHNTNIQLEYNTDLHSSQSELQERSRELEVLRIDLSRHERERETFLRQTRELEEQNAKLSITLHEQVRLMLVRLTTNIDHH